MLVKNGRAVMPFGVMGGHYQAAGHAHFLACLLTGGLDPQATVEAPRSFAFGGGLQLEPTIGPGTAAQLERMGHKIVWTTKPLGADVKGRYADLKQASADRCSRLLGTFVKGPEVQYHHEVYNQFLWNLF